MIADLLQTLLPDGSSYNELASDGVTPRPHWSSLIESIQDIGSEELAHRWVQAERRIRENGVTYNIYKDPLGKNRPWAIDPVPLITLIPSWQASEPAQLQIMSQSQRY